MENENELCNFTTLEENQKETIPVSAYKIDEPKNSLLREWADYFNYDFEIKSINNNIYKNSLMNYFENNEINDIKNSISLRMSNCINFSFKKKDDKIDYLLTLENINFEEDNEDENYPYSDRIQPYVDNSAELNAQKISAKFCDEIFASVKYSNTKVEPCDQPNTLISNEFLLKQQLKIAEMKNKILLNELDQKDKIIELLNERAIKIKAQNDVYSDENKKLIEIINLFKIMNEIDKSKKNLEQCDNDSIYTEEKEDIKKENLSIAELDRIITQSKEYIRESQDRTALFSLSSIQFDNKNLPNTRNGVSPLCYMNTPSIKSSKRLCTGTSTSTNKTLCTKSTKNKSSSKKSSLTSDYSNSYLFKAPKSYITITKNSYKAKPPRKPLRDSTNVYNKNIDYNENNYVYC